ncbi:ferredoxin--NADP reductase [Pelistega europaea]|uniref:ferredoxin--NADP(+) reductase n=1 Tax=Pelistega europaea TaxID=106147 RepID=A0A7Y4LBE1_9BURK|nr:ferredoxin--NADP reductase [Pelistega europaea]NOL49211.1 ferredoxin--NADP reductase [Pelistega europaea]
MSEQRYTLEKITNIHYWVEKKLFSIKTTRAPEFSFKPGQFARLGLPTEAGAEPSIWRGFSMVNPADSDYLEFYAVVVPDGLFSPRLASLQVGDTIYIDKSPIGFLTLDNFPNGGESLWLLATGTGLSAYLSILHDAKTWTLFNKVVLCHGVRYANELSYQDLIQSWQQQWGERFIYLPLPTRETYQHYPRARLTTLIENQQLAALAGVELNPDNACVMLCGNPDMLTEARKLLGDQGFATGRRGNIGNLAVEKYW